jgi:hypothetical protein
MEQNARQFWRMPQPQAVALSEDKDTERGNGRR